METNYQSRAYLEEIEEAIKQRHAVTVIDILIEGSFLAMYWILTILDNNKEIEGEV